MEGAALSEPKTQEPRVLECTRCGFALEMMVALPAWCPLCDEDHPSKLRVRRERLQKKTSEVAA